MTRCANCSRPIVYIPPVGKGRWVGRWTHLYSPRKSCKKPVPQPGRD